MRVLAVNVGSSSVKLSVLDAHDAVAERADLPAPQGVVDPVELSAALAAMGPLDAIGHRIVHGGTKFTGPVRIDDDVVASARALCDLAPLHQATSLAALEVTSAAYPETPSVACFDTAFHAGMPGGAATYALPRHWRERFGLRRYGFHGLSHAYTSRRAAELLGQPVEQLRIVTCHLGAGASLAAVMAGRSVDTTMGFTPLDGLVMATRAGSLDPGLVLWLAEHAGTPPAELAATFEHRSGLLGLAGTADMRVILASAADGVADAQLALEVYTHRLRAGIASMAAAMDGLDAVVFTGGVGENAPQVRELAVRGLGFLGMALDGANDDEGEDRRIGVPGAAVEVLVVAAREDLEIAAETRRVLAAPRTTPR
jgi:acetate kinase